MRAVACLPCCVNQSDRQQAITPACLFVTTLEQALSAAIIMVGVGLLFLEFGHRLKC